MCYIKSLTIRHLQKCLSEKQQGKDVTSKKIFQIIWISEILYPTFVVYYYTNTL